MHPCDDSALKPWQSIWNWPWKMPPSVPWTISDPRSDIIRELPPSWRGIWRAGCRASSFRSGTIGWIPRRSAPCSMENADPRAPFGWIPGKDNYRPYRYITDCALFHENIRVRCRRCGRSKIFSGYALWWLFERKRWDDSLKIAGRRFRCSNLRCASAARGRLGVELTVTRDDPTGPQPSLPDERAWKRLVNRNRS